MGLGNVLQAAWVARRIRPWRSGVSDRLQLDKSCRCYALGVAARALVCPRIWTRRATVDDDAGAVRRCCRVLAEMAGHRRASSLRGQRRGRSTQRVRSAIGRRARRASADAGVAGRAVRGLRLEETRSRFVAVTRRSDRTFSFRLNTQGGTSLAGCASMVGAACRQTVTDCTEHARMSRVKSRRAPAIILARSVCRRRAVLRARVAYVQVSACRVYRLFRERSRAEGLSNTTCAVSSSGVGSLARTARPSISTNNAHELHFVRDLAGARARTCPASATWTARRRTAWRIAAQASRRDPFGTDIERRSWGVADEPSADFSGAQRYSREVDRVGNVLATHFLRAEGSPISTEDGHCAMLRFVHDEHGFRTNWRGLRGTRPASAFSQASSIWRM